MNKKGFTLVELLAIIVIIAIVSGISIYAIVSSINATKEKGYKVTINEIESNASSYLTENSNRLSYRPVGNGNDYEYQCVTVQNLIDYGYLDKNIVNSPVASDTNVKVTDYVYIKRDAKTKAIVEATYVLNNSDLVTSCNSAVLAYGDIKFLIEPDNSVWSREKTITINYNLSDINDVNTYGDYSYTYNYYNKSNNQVVASTVISESRNDTAGTAVKKIKVDKNARLRADILGKNNQQINYNSVDITGIDDIAPVIAKGSYSGATTVRKEVTIPLLFTDKESGPKYDTFTASDVKVKIGDTVITNIAFTKVSDGKYNVKVSDLTHTGKVYVVIAKDSVSDKVGNLNKELTIDTGISFSTEYTITYNANGGKNAPSPTKYNYASSGTVNLSSSVPTRDKFDFIGWSTSKTATTAEYTKGSAYPKNRTEDVTLYAVWKVKEPLVWDYTYVSDNYQVFDVPYTGYYKVELRGGKGANYDRDRLEAIGGSGAYTSGYIKLNEGERIYLYIGNLGWDKRRTVAYGVLAFNGASGGNWTCGNSFPPYNMYGGSATDIRIFSSEPSADDLKWDSARGLRSRIMVAAGAASANQTENGAPGGDLVGRGGAQGTGGTQTAAGGPNRGGFGYAGVAPYYPQECYNNEALGAGSGYYGGGAYNLRQMGNSRKSAGSGSSFISGFAGVNAVVSESSTTHTNDTLHFSGRYFVDSKMIVGENAGAGRATFTYYYESEHPHTNTKLDNVRYIKDCINGSNKNIYNHWVELQAIKDGVNVAKGKSVSGTVSAAQGSPYSNITNGIMDAIDIVNKKITEFGESSAQGYQCITVDLGSTYDLDEIAVWHYYYDNRTYKDATTAVSSDNSTWRTVISGSSQETSYGIRVSAYSN